MHTIRSYSSNGPYFPATQGVYQAASLKDVLFHTRLCMEDNDFMIGLFDDNGKCKGIWEDTAEGIPDGEGGMTIEKPAYVLYRPGDLSAGMWNLMVSKFKRA
jgi:hypothetical protein